MKYEILYLHFHNYVPPDQLLLHFKWEFPKTLHACLLSYEDLHIVPAVCLNHF